MKTKNKKVIAVCLFDYIKVAEKLTRFIYKHCNKLLVQSKGFIPYIENQNMDKIGKHAYYTFWYVIPTMPMFLLMPWILSKGLNFWLALAICILFTIICFIITAFIAKRFGIELMP